jgi:hypothetical protein
MHSETERGHTYAETYTHKRQMHIECYMHTETLTFMETHINMNSQTQRKRYIQGDTQSQREIGTHNGVGQR